MPHIHPTALVDPSAQLADDVQVGAFTTVGQHVEIDAGTVIGPHCVIEGHTVIGKNNRIFSHNAIGGPPQDKKYAGEPTRLEMGNRNTIREFCTINTGTVQDSGCTRMGDDNWIMATVHIAHDVQLGNQTILANSVGLAGHVQVGDWAIIGGLCGVHQFVKIGAHAMIGFSSAISQDVPPFIMVDGNPAAARGFNAEGLRRRGFSAERLAAVKAIYRLLYRSDLTLEQAQQSIAEVQEQYPEAQDDIRMMLDFLAQSRRGIVR
ncbi:MAG: acyl-ACP--UDP-N-acetylglucosamine O-acyltransferase [Brachymonas sp.]|nr:acyl-ACP--UDP-N-acetylglucosamine O-acyltransferase [Brachymonas sp.]